MLTALPLITRSLDQRQTSRGFLRLSAHRPGGHTFACALGFILSSDANTKHYHLDLELDDLRDSNTECMLRPQMMATIGPSAP